MVRGIVRKTPSSIPMTNIPLTLLKKVLHEPGC
jgi:hypothetical protein